jgi:hypothetical protein
VQEEKYKESLMAFTPWNKFDFKFLLMFVQFIFISIFPRILATIGVDVSQSVTQEQFECLKG